MGKADQIPSLDLFSAERADLLQTRASLQDEIQILELSSVSEAEDDLGTQAAMEAYDALRATQQSLTALNSESQTLALEIADSAAFIADLNRKREALDDAAAVVEEIDGIHFHYCPSCHAPTDDLGPHACHLCKTPFDSEQGKKRVSAIIADFDAQLKQSRMLQARRSMRVASLDAALVLARHELQVAMREFADVQRIPGSDERQKANALQRQVGYIDRQIEDLNEKLRIAEIVGALNLQKEELSAGISRLRERNESLERNQQLNLANAFSAIAEEVRSLLRDDVARQDSFVNPQNIEFGFGSNKITVDDHTYFSASSRVILRNSFFVGFLTAAANNRRFRHPRFLMMDSIEDKGMEPLRAHNFQHQIVSRVQAAESECQVIFGTSMIAPDLDIPAFTVGKFSTQSDRTLLIASKPTGT